MTMAHEDGKYRILDDIANFPEEIRATIILAAYEEFLVNGHKQNFCVLPFPKNEIDEVLWSQIKIRRENLEFYDDEKQSLFSMRDEFGAHPEQFADEDIQQEFADSIEKRIRETDENINKSKEGIPVLEGWRARLTLYDDIDPEDVERVQYFNSFSSIKEIPKEDLQELISLCKKYAP